MAAASRTVALLGGSFNPPHVAHQLVALIALETQDIDEIWFLPTWKHPFGKELASFDDRVAMTELACDALGPRASVSRIEETLAARPGFVASRTLDTVIALEEAHPGTGFRLVIGADILGETDKWWKWDELSRRAPPIIVGRPGFPSPPGAIPAIVGVSSTEIRTRIGHGDDAMPLLPRAVLRYIGQRGLYR
jgi:nicotinate-nucleotide adenylyltransferase